MLFADVPQVVIDLTAIFGFLVALSAVCAIFWRTPPLRWLRSALNRSFGEWVKQQVAEGAKGIEHLAADTRHRVVYHLGSNDTTTPIHQRISRLEECLGLEPVEQQADPPMFGPHGEPRNEDGSDA